MLRSSRLENTCRLSILKSANPAAALVRRPEGRRMSSKRGPPPEHGFRHDLTHSSTFRAAHSSTFRVAHSSTFRVAHSSTLHVAHSPTFYVGHTRFLHDLTHLWNFEKSDNLCIQTTLWERTRIYGSALWSFRWGRAMAASWGCRF